MKSSKTFLFEINCIKIVSRLTSQKGSFKILSHDCQKHKKYVKKIKRKNL